MTFGELRRAAKMTQEQAAEAIGVDKTVLVKWESGKTMPRKTNLHRMQTAYGCDIEEIAEAVIETRGGSAV